MSSHAAGSTSNHASSMASIGNKRPIALPGAPHRSHKKPKPARRQSLLSSSGSKVSHPLRQTSFPPEESRDLGERSPSVDSLLDASHDMSPVTKASKPFTAQGENPITNDDDDEDDDRIDDYGTTSFLVDGGVGDFGEDNDIKSHLSVLMEHFDQEQNLRYECYRRSLLNKAAVKKIANQVLSQSVTSNVGAVIGGFAKVYASDIITNALDIQKEWGDEGPLEGEHLLEAARRYRVENQGAVGNRYIGGTHTGPGPGPGDAIGGGITRLFR